MDGPELDELRTRIALGCRILAREGLIEDVLGHISARVDAETILVRSRGPHEAGLLFTTPSDVQLVRLADGRCEDPDYSSPNELALHVEVLRQRPDVDAVVHAHPPEVIAADLAGLPLVPLVGAYCIPGTQLARDGIPVFGRGVLIRRRELAEQMMAAMGDRPVCVLRGHGITAAGGSVEQAVGRALAVNTLARMTCRVHAVGGRAVALPEEDLDELPDLGRDFNEGLLWRHHVRRLEHEGLGLGD